MNVNDLLVKQIAAEQKQAFDTVDGIPVGGGGRGPNAAADLGHRTEGQQTVSLAGLDDQESGPGPVLLRSQSNIAHPSAGGAGGVIDDRAQQFAECEKAHH